MRTNMAIVWMALIMMGCNKDDPSASKVSAREAAEAPQAASPATTVRQARQADKATPFTQYIELTDGSQIELMYYAYSGMPVPWEKLAEKKSSEYRSETDGFRRNDMLKAIQPRLAEDIERFKAKRYFVIQTSGGLGHYDFSTKSFPLSGIKPDQAYSFSGESWIRPVNASSFLRLKMDDETKAKELEALVSKSWADGGLKIYFFAQDAEEVSGRRTIQAEITRIEVLSTTRTLIPSTRTGVIEQEGGEVIATI